MMENGQLQGQSPLYAGKERDVRETGSRATVTCPPFRIEGTGTEQPPLVSETLV